MEDEDKCFSFYGYRGIINIIRMTKIKSFDRNHRALPVKLMFSWISAQEEAPDLSPGRFH